MSTYTPTYDESFSLPEVVRALIPMRLKLAHQRSKAHFRWSLNPIAPNPNRQAPSEVERVLPPRASWVRPSLHRRRGRGSAEIQRRALALTLEPWLSDDGALLKTVDWGRRLLCLVEQVQDLAQHPERGLSVPMVRRIAKPGGGTRTRHVFVPLPERIFLKLLARYLTARLDPLLGPEVLAFRPHLADPRRHAIQWLRSYPHAAPFAGETDIQKCFDTLPHAAILRALAIAESELEEPLDPCAWKWVIEYLQIFARCAGGATSGEKGLPQGGALSPVLCNLTLRSADRAVRNSVSTDLLYLRYCDDMVILHPTEEGCRRALNAYADALKAIGLEVHKAVAARDDPKSFVEAKSRKPYRWSDGSLSANAYPWLSFLGYEVHATRVLRIRPARVQRHCRNVDDEMFALLRLVRRGERAGCPSRYSPHQLWQQISMYLLHRAVGRECPGRAAGEDRHWAAAFGEVDVNGFSLGQFRRLDRAMMRRLQILRLWLGDEPVHRFEWLHPFHFGAPFSYHTRFVRPGSPRPRSMCGQIDEQRFWQCYAETCGYEL